MCARAGIASRNTIQMWIEESSEIGGDNGVHDGASSRWNGRCWTIDAGMETDEGKRDGGGIRIQVDLRRQR